MSLRRLVVMGDWRTQLAVDTPAMKVAIRVFIVGLAIFAAALLSRL